MQIKVKNSHKEYAPAIVHRGGKRKAEMKLKSLGEWSQEALKMWVSDLLRNPKNNGFLVEYFENSIQELQQIVAGQDNIEKPAVEKKKKG